MITSTRTPDQLVALQGAALIAQLLVDPDQNPDGRMSTGYWVETIFSPEARENVDHFAPALNLGLIEPVYQTDYSRDLRGPLYRLTDAGLAALIGSNNQYLYETGLRLVKMLIEPTASAVWGNPDSAAERARNLIRVAEALATAGQKAAQWGRVASVAKRVVGGDRLGLRPSSNVVILAVEAQKAGAAVTVIDPEPDADEITVTIDLPAGLVAWTMLRRYWRPACDTIPRVAEWTGSATRLEEALTPAIRQERLDRMAYMAI